MLHQIKVLLLAALCVSYMTFTIQAFAADASSGINVPTKAPAMKTQPAAKPSQPTIAAKTATPAKDAKAAADEPIEPEEVPKDAVSAIDAGKKVIEDGKAKRWFAMSAGIIWLLMFLFKTARKRIDVMKKIPKRVLWIIVPLLSVAAMLAAKFQDDLAWGAAMQVLLSGPSVAFLNDFVKRGIVGKELSPMHPWKAS